MQINQFKEIDFVSLFHKQKSLSPFKAKNNEEWNKKAQYFNKYALNSKYNNFFLQKVNLKNIKTVLDVGCGVGNLSLIFAKKTEKVFAMDRAEKMLELLKKNMEKENIGNIIPVQKSWEDDWSDIPVCDIAIASRSLECKNIKDCIVKLNQKAKKAVYITYQVGNYIDDEILKVMKRDIIPRPDYIFLLNILYSLGIHAKLDFIISDNKKNYNDINDFIKNIEWSIGHLNDFEKENLKQYFCERKKSNKPLYKPKKWAFIWWEKN